MNAKTDIATRLGQSLNLYAPALASGRMTIGLGLAAVLAGTTTYLAITDVLPVPVSPQLVLGLLLVDLVLLLALATLIAWRLVALWMARRSGTAGARLHVRLVAMFAIVAITPTIIMAVYSTLTINLGFQTWFGERVGRVISASVSVAEAYVDEHKMVIRGDILAMANDLNRARPIYYQSRARFADVVNQQARLRSLAEAYVITSSGEILSKSRMSFLVSFSPPSPDAMARASEGDVVILTSEHDSQVRALFRLDQFLDGFLYVSRYVDPRVLNTAMQARRAASEYKVLEGERDNIQVAFALIYLVLALLVLLAAVALGFWLANRLVEPIGRLVVASERVRDGDLSARVEEADIGDEIGVLSRAFNRMTGQLSAQHEELVSANLQLDRRRRFTEAALEGVTSGVIGLDANGNVNLANRAALTLLDTTGEDLSGIPVERVVPQMRPLINEARARAGRMAEGEIIVSIESEDRILLVRVVKVREDTVSATSDGIATDKVADRTSFVVTFDDITQLVSAQRTAAWADVARRIAHEIKNPLTPIQLSAERLQRKYTSEITSDPETFERCTDTIVRQVRDIGHMIDEFSSFARMPAPVLADEDLVEVVRQAIFQQALAAPDVKIIFNPPTAKIILRCDRAQINQAIVNIIKNAMEAIEARQKNTLGVGMIEVRISTMDSGRIVLSIADNGCGLPSELRTRLTEPYVTTRDSGTGLGLAIVRKIAEDHDARIGLTDLSELEPERARMFAGEMIDAAAADNPTGAVVRIDFPASVSSDDYHIVTGVESDMSAIKATQKVTERGADVA